MGTLFDAFRNLVKLALQDVSFVKGNLVLQDVNFRADMVAHADALRPDQNIILDVGSVTTVSGGLTADLSNNVIKFAPAGFNTVLSNADNSVVAPGKMWRRVGVSGAVPADGVRYLLADATRGVLKMGTDLLLRGVIPGMGQHATTGYDAPSAVLTFTIASVEYVAIAMATHHMVRVYNYLTGALVATMGTLDSAGATSSLLNTPVDLAFDTGGNRLYILCRLGQPAGATASGGFIARYDMATPGAPVFVDFYASAITNGSVARKEVNGATSICIDNGKLWVANGTPVEIGSIDLTTNACTLYLGATTIQGYPLGVVGSIRVKVVGSNRFLYVANSTYGSVLVFSLQSNAAVNVFSFAAQTAHLLAYREYGAVSAAEPDSVTGLDDVVREMVVVSDGVNHRVVSLDEQVYLSSSQCVFVAQQFAVPIRLRGYALAGNMAPNVVSVEYKNSVTAPSWRRLEQLADVSPSTYFAFRLTVQLPMGYPLDVGRIDRLTILGEQA